MSLLNDSNLLYAVEQGSEVLRSFIGDDEPVAGVILGSGLNHYGDKLDDVRFLAFTDVPFMKASTATAHKAQFALGTAPGTGKRVLCLQGRLHKYEGYTALDVAFPVWLMAECGIGTLITTNAAGALNPEYEVGDFCIMSDQINFTGQNPLVGRSPDLMASRFASMYNCFDPELRAIAHEAAQAEGVAVREGVYLGLLGPSLETPAEVRLFASWGADTVAMSVVEEVIAARHRDMRVLGMSLITNMGCGIGDADPNEQEIMDVAELREDAFTRLMTGIVSRL